MTSADRRRPAACAALLALGCCAILAHPARAEVVRITTEGSSSGRPAEVRVAAFPATAAARSILGVPVSGLPEETSSFEAAPGAGPVAYVGDDPARVPTDDDFEVAVPRRPAAGLLDVAGGAVRPFSDASGAPLGPDFRPDGLLAGDRIPPWTSWAPGAGSVVLHGFGRERAADPWLSTPSSRRCEVATLRCAAPVPHDVVDLPGGGAVEVRSDLVAPTDGDRSVERDSAEGRITRRRFDRRAGRRFTLTLRIAGRPGLDGTYSRTGTLRTGAPAYDRAFPGPAGVLVRTTLVRTPTRRDRATIGDRVAADDGPVLIVRRDGSLVRIPRDRREVVGTLPDGRWLLLGGPVRRFGSFTFRGPEAARPLQTLDADGRIAPVLSAGRPVTAVRIANAVGLRDSLATSASIGSAGLDRTSGLLVLDLGLRDDAAGRLVALPLDGSAPPRLVRSPRGVEETTYLVR